MAEDVTVSIRADTAPFQTALENLEKLSGNFGNQLTGALKSATVSGRELDDVLRRVGLNLAGMALTQGLKPLQSLAGSLFSGLLGGLFLCPLTIRTRNGAYDASRRINGCNNPLPT